MYEYLKLESGNDIAYIELAEPVDNISIKKIVYQSKLFNINKITQSVLVGYGKTFESEESAFSEQRDKKSLNVEIDSIGQSRI